MAISAEYLNLSQSAPLTEPANTLLQRLIDEGTVYIPQALTASQFSTLNALLHRLISHPETHSETHPETRSEARPEINPAHLTARLDRDLASGTPASLAPRFRAYPLGLDELDTLARTHAGFPFADLPSELQDAMLDLIAAGDLTTSKLNLALWLEDLRSTTTSRPPIPLPIDRLY